MTIIGLDPGNAQSAIVVYEPGSPGRVVEFFDELNQMVPEYLARQYLKGAAVLVAEYMRPRGMPTSAEEMDTMFELGRMRQCWSGEFVKFDRKDVKLLLCGSVRATDSTIRQALLDRWGGSKAIAGPKKCPVCKGKGWYGRQHKACPNLDIDLNGKRTVCFGGDSAGPLHGISGDEWSALALAVAYSIKTGLVKE